MLGRVKWKGKVVTAYQSRNFFRHQYQVQQSLGIILSENWKFSYLVTWGKSLCQKNLQSGRKSARKNMEQTKTFQHMTFKKKKRERQNRLGSAPRDLPHFQTPLCTPKSTMSLSASLVYNRLVWWVIILWGGSRAGAAFPSLLIYESLTFNSKWR